jgi:hypothetical protein
LRGYSSLAPVVVVGRNHRLRRLVVHQSGRRLVKQLRRRPTARELPSFNAGRRASSSARPRGWSAPFTANLFRPTIVTSGEMMLDGMLVRGVYRLLANLRPSSPGGTSFKRVGADYCQKPHHRVLGRRPPQEIERRSARQP